MLSIFGGKFTFMKQPMTNDGPAQNWKIQKIV